MKVVLAVVAVLGASAGAAHAAGWRYEMIKDPITDAARGMAALDGPAGAIAVKCDKNGSDVMYLHFISNSYLGSLRYKFRNAILRIDDGELKNLNLYHDGRSAILPSGDKQVAPLAGALGSAKKIAMRFTDYQGNFVDMVFEADGDPTNIKKAFETCGQAWPN
jgi:hypothetical protein